MSDKLPTFAGGPFMAGWSEGYDEGRAQGRNDVGVILTDLIAELRSQWEAFTAADGHKSLRMKGDGWVDAARNRAEARLREVGSDD